MRFSAGAMRSIGIAGMTSPKGRSHTFDIRADGYTPGEGIEAVMFEPGRDPQVTSADQALGSAVRQDGRSASLTAPSGKAQQGVLIAALMDARKRARDFTILEAHGTGTALAAMQQAQIDTFTWRLRRAHGRRRDLLRRADAAGPVAALVRTAGPRPARDGHRGVRRRRGVRAAARLPTPRRRGRRRDPTAWTRTT